MATGGGGVVSPAGDILASRSHPLGGDIAAERPSPSSNGFGSTAAATTPYASMGRLHPSTSTAANKSSGGGGDSDSDPPQQQPQHNRSRQKKFLKNFSQLPTATEEVVLQRYSCALVSDILLQGHLYITENYFAFHSNVFGYVTKLQIPIRSVIKVSKEKTAKIIPNAVGLATATEKHVFGSLLSRDSTFKFMTHVWKRAMRGIHITADEVDPTQTAYPAGLDDIVVGDASSESDGNGGGADDDGDCDVVAAAGGAGSAPQSVGGGLIPAVSGGVSAGSKAVGSTLDAMNADPLGSSYLVKRLSAASASLGSTVGTDGVGGGSGAGMCTRGSLTPSRAPLKKANPHPTSSGFIPGGNLMSLLVLSLLFFSLCSSVYLLFRVHALQLQVESRRDKYDPSYYSDDLASLLDTESSERMRKILSNNVGQISQVRQNLERLSSLLQRDGTDVAANEKTTTAPPQLPKAVADQELGVKREQGAENTGKDEF